jgi:hypothetical protein
MELGKLIIAKLNIDILINTELFRIKFDEKKGLTKKVENHKQHLNYLQEIRDIFKVLDSGNQLLSNRNAELNYTNTKLLHEIDKLKEINKNLINGI